MWLLAVLGVITRRSAICLLDIPRASRRRTSTSREVRPAGLTSREVEVLRLLARGMSSKQIAERLVITPKTASNHIEHIYSKVGVTNRALASLFAAKHGLISG